MNFVFCFLLNTQCDDNETKLIPSKTGALMTTVKLTNVGKQQVATLNPTSPVISICDKYSSPAVIPNESNRRILRLTFFTMDHMPSVDEDDCLSKDQVRDIINFIKLSAQEGHDKIYLQCGEGRIRSYTLASGIANYHRYSDEGIIALNGIVLEYCNKDSVIKQGIEDRKTANRLFNYLEDLNKEIQETPSE